MSKLISWQERANVALEVYDSDEFKDARAKERYALKILEKNAEIVAQCMQNKLALFKKAGLKSDDQMFSNYSEIEFRLKMLAKSIDLHRKSDL